MLIATGMEAASPFLRTEEEFDALMDKVKSKLPDNVVASNDDEVSSQSSDEADALARLCDPHASDDDADAAEVAEATSSSGSSGSPCSPKRGSEAAEVAEETATGNNPAQPEVGNISEPSQEQGILPSVGDRALLCRITQAATGFGYHVGGSFVDNHEELPELYHVGRIANLSKKAIKACAAVRLGIHASGVELGTIGGDGNLAPIPPGEPVKMDANFAGTPVTWILAWSKEAPAQSGARAPCVSGDRGRGLAA